MSLHTSEVTKITHEIDAIRPTLKNLEDAIKSGDLQQIRESIKNLRETYEILNISLNNLS